MMRADDIAYCAKVSLTRKIRRERHMALDINWSAMRKRKSSACSFAYCRASLYVYIVSSARLTLSVMLSATVILVMRRCLVSLGCYSDVLLTLSAMLPATAILMIRRCLVSLGCCSDVCNPHNTMHLHLADTCCTRLRRIGRHCSRTRIPLSQFFLRRATWHHNSLRTGNIYIYIYIYIYGAH